MAVQAVEMPLVFGGAESNPIHRAGEKALLLRLPIVESDFYTMCVVVILVDQHDRPLAVRPLHCLRSHQRVAGGVAHVAGNAIEPVHGIDWLDPLIANELRSEILREIARNLVVFIDSW